MSRQGRADVPGQREARRREKREAKRLEREQRRLERRAGDVTLTRTRARRRRQRPLGRIGNPGASLE
jgi:hypothetical protein